MIFAVAALAGIVALVIYVILDPRYWDSGDDGLDER